MQDFCYMGTYTIYAILRVSLYMFGHIWLAIYGWRLWRSFETGFRATYNRILLTYYLVIERDVIRQRVLPVLQGNKSRAKVVFRTSAYAQKAPEQKDNRKIT